MTMRDPQTIAVVILGVFVAAVGAFGLDRIAATEDAVAAGIQERSPVTAGRVSVEGTVRVTIQQGALPDEIVDRLAAAGVVEDAESLRALLYFTSTGGLLRAGEYEFPLNTPPAEVVRRLRVGPDLIERITFRPGLRVQEIGETLEREDLFTAAEWQQAVAGTPPRPFMERETDFLGFLMPGTYEIKPETTAADLLAAMLDRFEEEVTPGLIAEAESQGWSLYEVLTLASVVVKEAVHDDEKPEVGAVFRNRVEQGMPLQADPTVQFALTLGEGGPASVEEYGWWKAGLTLDDLGLDSPYNTYYYPGLMPGPIANSDIEAIRAVVRPAPVDHLYFVAGPECDGRHLFASTLDAHNANVEIFRASSCAAEE
ncbi:MAG: endolytic transglycosylase MltG [Dehalococcoidia bacterium]|nr:endolytic transglycosylase MltG [Dehalococcoidia bacterium]